MRVLATHPGRYGDLLWALPTVRALAEQYACSVDLLLSAKYSAAPLRTLLGQQLYVGQVIVAKDWAIEENAPITPRVPPSLPSGYDLVVHLGYESWPRHALPFECARIAKEQAGEWTGVIDLDTPWIAVPYLLPQSHVTVGFTDEHFELKFGLYWLLREHLQQTGDETKPPRRPVNVAGSPRWEKEGGSPRKDWIAAANWIATSKLFVGCCSALHVLACAIGVPVLVVEPATARHHKVFYPYGTHGPRVQLLRGGDGLPTVDSRHLVDAVEAQLQPGMQAMQTERRVAG